MATYLGTHGSKIQNYTTDPDNPNTGEVWYNDTSNALKFQYPAVTTVGSWRTAADMVSGAVYRSFTNKYDKEVYRKLIGAKEIYVQFWPK